MDDELTSANSWWSSEFNLVNTVFFSVVVRIYAWISLLSFGLKLRDGLIHSLINGFTLCSQTEQTVLTNTIMSQNFHKRSLYLARYSEKALDMTNEFIRKY